MKWFFLYSFTGNIGSVRIYYYSNLVSVIKKDKYFTGSFLTKVKVKVLATRLCLILCGPMDYNPPGSSVREILQARILEWVTISYSRGIFSTRGLNPGLPHCRQILYQLSHQGRCFLTKK